MVKGGTVHDGRLLTNLIKTDKDVHDTFKQYTQACEVANNALNGWAAGGCEASGRGRREGDGEGKKVRRLSIHGGVATANCMRVHAPLVPSFLPPRLSDLFL